MIRNYNDHAANERTFLAWMRTGLSAIALGILVKKGSIFAVVIAGASSPELSDPARASFSEYGGPVLVGIGIATMAGAAIRFVRTALRIDDHNVHSAGIVRLASALSRPWRGDSAAFERVSVNASPAATSQRNGLLRGDKRVKLRLVGGAGVSRIR